MDTPRKQAFAPVAQLDRASAFEAEAARGIRRKSSAFRLVPADVPAVGLALLLLLLWVLNLTALHLASQPAVETSVAWEPRV